MGRWSTGAITTGECMKVNISTFAKEIKQGHHSFTGSMEYSNGATIGIALKNEFGQLTASLKYTHTIGEEKNNVDYQIRIVSVRSNLGKGEVYYFLCPFSFKRCKTLYMGYNSLYFKSREAYSHPIYYPSQLSSHNDRHNDIYWRLERKLPTLREQHPKRHYRGKKTKPQLRLERLRQKQYFHDEMRWTFLPKALMKFGITI